MTLTLTLPLTLTLTPTLSLTLTSPGANLSDYGYDESALGAEAAARRRQDGALFFLTRKLISEPKIVINARIVVVGVSDTALAFLETLLTVPYLTFTNLYLLAPRAAERLRTPRGVLPDEAATGDAATGDEPGRRAAPFLSHTCGYSP